MIMAATGNGNGTIRKTIIGTIVAALGAAGVGGVNYAEGRLDRMDARIEKLVDAQHQLEIWDEKSDTSRIVWIERITRLLEMHRSWYAHPRKGVAPHSKGIP